jgi:DNA polymerase-3 subunit beta
MSSGHDLIASIIADDLDTVQRGVEVKQVMQFTIKKFVLQVLLDKAITVVPTRDVMPVLKCFQFHLEPKRLTVIASDCEITLIASTPMVSVTWPGVAVFPARKLLDIVKSAEDADVQIKVTGRIAHIVIGRASWQLKLQGGDDYPAMPVISEAQFTSVDRDDLKDAIARVRYAASRDPNRANLNIIDIRDGKLTASDGSRIQQIRVADFPISLRIPISAVDDLLRLLRFGDLETVHVGQSEDQLIFRLGSDVLIVNKFRAKFPDMEAEMLRPALENRHELGVERVELVAAVKRVRINADKESFAIALHLDGAGTLTVQARDKFGNTATEAITCTYTGPERNLVVNHKFLTDMIHIYGDETCTFKLGDDTKTRRSPLMLRQQATGAVGVVQQMQADWVGQ